LHWSIVLQIVSGIAASIILIQSITSSLQNDETIEEKIEEKSNYNNRTYQFD